MGSSFNLEPSLDAKAEANVRDSQARISAAIRTALILSGELLANPLASVAADTLLARAAVLAVVGIGITVVVYGAVALIVKMDDIGLHLAERSSTTAQAVGRGLVHAMPKVLTVLSVVGTVAMLWVGGGIVLHGLYELGFSGPEHMVEAARHAVEAASGSLGPVIGWLTYATLSALFGIAVGAIIVFALHKVLRIGSH